MCHTLLYLVGLTHFPNILPYFLCVPINQFIYVDGLPGAECCNVIMIRRPRLWTEQTGVFIRIQTHIHAHTKLYLCRLTKRKSSTHVIVKIRSFHSLDLLCSCRATIVVLYTFIPTGTSKSCSKLGIIRVFDTSFGVN